MIRRMPHYITDVRRFAIRQFNNILTNISNDVPKIWQFLISMAQQNYSTKINLLTLKKKKIHVGKKIRKSSQSVILKFCWSEIILLLSDSKSHTSNTDTINQVFVTYSSFCVTVTYCQYWPLSRLCC